MKSSFDSNLFVIYNKVEFVSVPLSFEEISNSISKRYVNWLHSKSYLQGFKVPETAAGFCYTHGITEQNTSIFDSIFRFLASRDILDEANGTFSLNHDLDYVIRKMENYASLPKNHPLTFFLNRGLSLIEDRIEGGTGEFDRDSDSYLLERVLTLPVFALRTPSEIALNKIQKYFINPKIAIYSLYPSICSNYLVNDKEKFEEIWFISPSPVLRNQAISFFELYPPTRAFSSQVVTRDEVINSSFDCLLIPNGLFFKFNFKEQIKYFRSKLVKDGFLIFKDNESPKNQLGFEPILTLFPDYQELLELNSLDRLLKANGFSNVKLIADSSFIYVQKL